MALDPVQADLKGKTVLITGANQGIGKAAAVALHRLGADLVLVCRNADKGRAAVEDIRRTEGGGTIELLIGDLSVQSEVRRVAAEFLAGHPRLDVLLNNAGVLATSRRMTVDGVEFTFATNHLGYYLLTHLLRDVLVASAPSRVVSVSSELHRRATMNWDDPQYERGWSSFTAYNQSKLCNVMWTYDLARRLEGTGVTANCLHPGVIASGFGRTDGGFTGFLVSLASPFMLTPEKGADTSVYLAASPAVAGVTGTYFDKRLPRSSSKASYDTSDWARLWALSEKLTGTTTV